MRTTRDAGIGSRDWANDIRNPLAQASLVWATVDRSDLEATCRVWGLRRTDPGGIFALSDQLLGAATRWTVLGDNVIGAWAWSDVALADQYRAVSTGAGAFIASAMAYVRVSGPDAPAVLDALTPRKLSDLPVNGSRFVLFTTPAGGIDDEAIVVRTGRSEFLMSCGAGRPPGWLAIALRDFPEAAVDGSPLCSFNIKGPLRLAAVLSIVQPGDRDAITEMATFATHVVRTTVGAEARILKSVIGYEVWAPPDVLCALWRTVITGRPMVVPCGWELLTVYRMECRAIVFGLFPVDLHAGTTPFEIGAGWMVPPVDDGRDYIGRSALMAGRHSKRLWLAGLRAVDPDVPPPLVGREVFDSTSGAFLGYVTSSAHSPREGRALGFAHLSPRCSEGMEVTVEDSHWLVSLLPFPQTERPPAA